MRRALYPGTFDPMTNGHLDIVRRATQLFDEVVIVVAKNVGKQPLFSLDERVALVRASVKDMPSVRVEEHQGLIVHYAKEIGATALIRGLRAISDFDIEFRMASVNRKLASAVETVFLMPSDEWSFLSSSVVRELWSFDADYQGFVPKPVSRALNSKTKREK
jgi:pantetheine-phosphate adenylyltransferase